MCYEIIIIKNMGVTFIIFFFIIVTSFKEGEYVAKMNASYF